MQFLRNFYPVRTVHVQHHSSEAMPYKSRLFKRNNGGMVTKKPYAKRAKRTYNRYNIDPIPYVPPRPIQIREKKSITGTQAVLTLKDVGQCFHLDQVDIGPGQDERNGQKFRVTGCHIRGVWEVKTTVAKDLVGYALYWDKQPNEALCNPGDIFEITSSPIARAFPNLSNDGRFIPLGRKMHKATMNTLNADVVLASRNESSGWYADDYWDFTDKNLIANVIQAGGPTITDRTSGALIMVGLGTKAASLATNMQMNFRVFFEDV